MALAFNPFTGTFDQISDPIESAFTFAAACSSSDAVGDCVHISADAVGGVLQVSRVDVTSAAKMPAIGIIVEKPSPTTSVVAYLGAVALGGLSPGRAHFVGTNSRPSATCPTGPALVQAIGFALDGTRLMFNPSMQMVKVQ